MILGESPPRRVADQRGEVGIAKRERTKRGIEVNIGSMNEAERHEILA